MVTEEEIKEVILLNKNLSLTQIRFLIKNPSIAKSVNLKPKHKTQLRLFRNDNRPSTSTSISSKQTPAPSTSRASKKTTVKKAKKVYKKKAVVKAPVKAPVKVPIKLPPKIPVKPPVKKEDK